MPYQLYQARAAGADAVLFIASILSDQDLTYLRKVALQLGLSILVEVHNSEELERVLNLGTFDLIGINNRDLKTFETDLKTTEFLAKKFSRRIHDQGVLLVSESGLFTRDDLDRVQQAGCGAVLVGESLMRKTDVTVALKNLIAG